MSQSPSVWIDLILSFIYPMVLKTFISLNWKNIMTESFSMRAYMQHWKSVSVQINISRLVRKSKMYSTWIKTNSLAPANKWVWCVTFNIVRNSFHVKFPIVWVWMFTFCYIALQKGFPFWIFYFLFYVTWNTSKGSC